MDPQTMLIGASAFIVSAIVIYLISVCTMREKTFEEVMEEQRKRLQEQTQTKQPKEKKEKVKKKFRKRVNQQNDQGDRTEDKSAQVSDDSDGHKMVELELDPEIIEPITEHKVESVPKGKKKKVPTATLR